MSADANTIKELRYALEQLQVEHSVEWLWQCYLGSAMWL
jgi:hypothetical protein